MYLGQPHMKILCLSIGFRVTASHRAKLVHFGDFHMSTLMNHNSVATNPLCNSKTPNYSQNIEFSGTIVKISSREKMTALRVRKAA